MPPQTQHRNSTQKPRASCRLPNTNTASLQHAKLKETSSKGKGMVAVDGQYQQLGRLGGFADASMPMLIVCFCCFTC
jgi:hypothetical protein